MSLRLDSWSLEGGEISENLFGGNLLANRGELYGEGQYDTAINDLGITTLRYPGGSRTEKSFDINNPDAEQVLDKETGQVDDWIALSDFFAYAEENGHPVSIVLPTRFNLSERVDATGNRVPDFSEDDLRNFINDVASGHYGSPEINAFEIGNEYWHSGKMNSIEYGRLASEMTAIIDDELSRAAVKNPAAANIEITVQMGYNYGDARLTDHYEGLDPEQTLQQVNLDYGLTLDDNAFYADGTVNWGYINNKIIINEFEREATIDDVDGVIAHVYSLGDSNEWSRVYELEMLQSTWMKEFPELSVHVTEWNQKGVTTALDRDEDYGLHQASEMLEIMEEFIRLGVDHAQVWPLINFTDNALNNGWTYDETNAPGGIFKMMADNLPGKKLLDFNPESERVTEAEFNEISVRGYAGDSELLLYITAKNTDGVVSTDLDLNTMLIGFETMELTILGVEDNANIGSNRSNAEFETIAHELVFEDGVLDVSLDPKEILQVLVKGVVATEELAPFVNQAVDDPIDTQIDEEFDFPTVPINDDLPAQEEGPEGADDGFVEGLEWMLAAIPFLGVLALLG